jgi:uncharacterized protein YbgA (DUF1722 family)/uncharacterized protein YbbK (DUF523 family)
MSGPAPCCPAHGRELVRKIVVKPRIGISSCLLGHNVRFDGGHKRDPFLVETFGQFVEWVPVCPEVELGLGAPRDSLRLAQTRGPDDLRMVNNRTGEDITGAMRGWAAARVDTLAAQDLSGYILKKDSPSCGMERVKVYGPGGVPARSGRGLFAAALMSRLPDLPVDEEGRLTDPRLRDNFIERVFAYQRLTAFFRSRWTVGGLVRFHTSHKLALLAHDPRAYAALGRLVAEVKPRDRAAVQRDYRAGFMEALARPATPRKQVNVLMHMLGYFRKTLDEATRRDLLQTIEDYRQGLVPLVVPITLFRHYVRRQGEAYLAAQVYLDPHPKELMLRNHV